MSNEIENAKAALGVAGQIVSLAKESPELTEAGQKFADSALVLSKAVNNVLLPIAAVNFAFDKGRKYFDEKFQKDLEGKASNIAPEDVVEPKASVAAPVLQGLAFSHEEPSLKDMYLSLLRTAMNRSEADTAHPAYAEVIKQLSAVEAPLLLLVLKGKSPSPIVKLNRKVESAKGEVLIKSHLIPWIDGSGNQKEIPGVISMIENWRRLGLVDIQYDAHLTNETLYDWVTLRPEYIALKEEIGDSLEIGKGYYLITEFGKSFAKAVS
ncbi:DUF4393 domain-containing protein [uncultured Pseudosulfitobacter sp.]|uniref:DUF4393 domain-containing protein n=1 Tax=uncultured Pseudosulfitobacter sp. TaxID=2854214 RepID=UPI0030D8DC2A